MQVNPITILDEAINAVENGRSDEALLILNMLRVRLSKTVLDDGIYALNTGDRQVQLPNMTNRIEVIDHGRTDGCRHVVSKTAAGGYLELQDNGRTAKLFIRSGNPPEL